MSAQKTILFLTNLKNGAEEEDLFLIERLKQDMRVIVAHPLECRPFLHQVDGVVIRNAWPTHAYKDAWLKLIDTFHQENIRTYNPMSGSGDTHGKFYLAELYSNSFPVIPSVLSIQDINRLPTSPFYWTKPIWGCDGSGAAKKTKQQLIEQPSQDIVIQPFVEFTEEPCFYFIDNEFACGITTTHRLDDENITSYYPTGEEIALAQDFVKWNKLPYGIQRIDFVRLKTGELLLTEIEDNCPYLYLFDLPEKERLIITEKLVKSIRFNLGLGD